MCSRMFFFHGFGFNFGSCTRLILWFDFGVDFSKKVIKLGPSHTIFEPKPHDSTLQTKYPHSQHWYFLVLTSY
jgi:hypothetical protein